MMIDFDIELALRLSKIVQGKCENVPPDIGVTLAQEMFLYDFEMAGKRGAEAGKKLRNTLKNRYETES